MTDESTAAPVRRDTPPALEEARVRLTAEAARFSVAVLQQLARDDPVLGRKVLALLRAGGRLSVTVDGDGAALTEIRPDGSVGEVLFGMTREQRIDAARLN